VCYLSIFLSFAKTFLGSIINDESYVSLGLVIKELSKQLEDWRESVNISGLNWSEEETLGFVPFPFDDPFIELRFNGARSR
jgi:hypothetical protein